MFRPKGPPPATLWIPTSALPTSPAHGFYQQLDRVLAKAGFGDTVRQACAPFYEMDASRGGRPAVDPEVYFKPRSSRGQDADRRVLRESRQ